MYLRWFIAVPLQVLAYESNVTLVTTGGTIAGVEFPGLPGYIPGLLSPDDLLAPLRGRITNVRLETKAVASVGSDKLGWNDYWNIHSAVLTAVDDPFQQGVVVSIGTDLGAAAAFFLDMIMMTDKPIVFVGAMLPANALSADGWRNLLNAIYIASSEQSCGRGVLWTSDGDIYSASYVQKSHTDALGAFRSPGPGALGFLKGSKPLFYYPRSRPLGGFKIDPTGSHSLDLPRVVVITAHRDMLPGQIRATVLGFEAKGLVLAGLGAGSLPPGMVEEVRSLEQDHGTVVVVARQTLDGRILAADVGIPGGFLDVHKCQVAIEVLLSLGYEYDQIKAVFTAQGREEPWEHLLVHSGPGKMPPGSCQVLSGPLHIH